VSEFRPRGSPDVARILVLRRRALGDLVCSLPALAALRADYPHARMDLVMDAPWVEAARAWAPVDRVLTMPSSAIGRMRFAWTLRHARYDLVIDFLSTPQTAILSWLTGARTRVGLDLSGRAWAYNARVPRPGSWPYDMGGRPVYVGDAMSAIVSWAYPEGRPGPSQPTLAREPHHPPRVALAPGATWSAKAWPARAYADVAMELRERCQAEVTVFWAPGEEELARSICDMAPGARLAPPGTVVDLAKGLEQHDLLVSGDSGARHLAQYLGLATVSVFGPTDPWTQTPPEGPHRFLRYPIACAPCQLATCALRRNYCMSEVTAAQVAEEAAALLARRASA
jgi:ADP-heptose:LPS heptosyltransferase